MFCFFLISISRIPNSKFVYILTSFVYLSSILSSVPHQISIRETNFHFPKQNNLSISLLFLQKILQKIQILYFNQKNIHFVLLTSLPSFSKKKYEDLETKNLKNMLALIGKFQINVGSVAKDLAEINDILDQIQDKPFKYFDTEEDFSIEVKADISLVEI